MVLTIILCVTWAQANDILFYLCKPARIEPKFGVLFVQKSETFPRSNTFKKWWEIWLRVDTLLWHVPGYREVCPLDYFQTDIHIWTSNSIDFLHDLQWDESKGSSGDGRNIWLMHSTYIKMIVQDFFFRYRLNHQGHLRFLHFLIWIWLNVPLS